MISPIAQLFEVGIIIPLENEETGSEKLSLAKELKISSRAEILATSDLEASFSLMRFFLEKKKKKQKLQFLPLVSLALPGALPELLDHLAGKEMFRNSQKVVSPFTRVLEGWLIDHSLQYCRRDLCI